MTTAPDIFFKTIYIKGNENTGNSRISLSAEFVGDGEVEITAVAAIATATVGEIAFIDKADVEITSAAACLIVPATFAAQTTAPQIRVSDPKLALARVAKKLKKHERRYFGAEHSIIAKTADVRTIEIGSFVTIGENSFKRPGDVPALHA